MPYASKSANYILYTPFDSKSIIDSNISEKLTQKEFLENCYVKPRFQTDFLLQITDEYTESYDYIINYDQLKDMINQQSKDYESFKKWMDSDINFKIYTISGNAGTGKTTFIHRLESEIEDKNWIIFDVANSRDFIDWFNGIKTNIQNFQTPYSKLYAIVLQYIKALLFDYPNKDTKSICNGLSAILKAYKTKFNNVHLRGTDYFDGLARISKNLFVFNKRLYIEEAAKYTQRYFESKSAKYKGDVKNIFRTALDVFIITISCVFDLNIHVIVFDNIERFIAHDEIYNKDVDLIRRELSSYSKEINEKQEYYHGKFKFILGMRTSSERMCGVKLHSADELPSDLNITNWFLIDNIITSKFNWYKKQGFTTIDINTVSQIVCDLRACSKYDLTGLQLFINPLFNDNLRLITDFIGMIVEKDSNRRCIHKYIELWGENTPVSRFAARSIIRGLIYQELDNNDNLFHHLQLYTEIERKKHDENEDDYGLSYVRKILTILYNRQNDVTLETTIAALCGISYDVQEYWNKTLPERNKNNIAEILFYMNSYNRRENDWIQFIDMQIIGMENNTSIDDVQTLRNLIDEKMSLISLKIMPAGEAYLRYMVASFEYFSFRFHKNHVMNYQPLFSVIPSLDELKNCTDIKSLPCYTIINYVKENAINCMQNLKEKGDIEICFSDTHIEKSHSQRIVEQHQGFLDEFVYYLRTKYPNEYKTNIKIIELVNECNEIKTQYRSSQGEK